MSADLSPQAIMARLRHVAALSDLRTEARLAAKIDYSAPAIDSRLRAVAGLRRLCLDLAQGSGLPAGDQRRPAQPK